MAPANSQGNKRDAYWNRGDDVRLCHLLEKGKIKVEARLQRDLEPFRAKYFPQIKYKNFRVIFLNKARKWRVDQAKKGNNDTRKRGKYSFSSF